MNKFFEILELKKKEFKHAKLLWKSLKDRCASSDELESALLRIRLRIPNETVLESEKIYKVIHF